MPTFPISRHLVPRRLNPLSLRHYALVAYWIYCCPSTLKCYLYHAHPKLYTSSQSQGLLRSFSDSAYRNLYLCVAPTVLLVSIALSLPLMAICQRSAIHWGHWAVGLAIGLSIGIFHFIIYGVSLSRTLNIASGVVGGVVSGNTTGVANASVLSAVLGRSRVVN